MAKAADHVGIQFRWLNRRKGPAVRVTRAQTDRHFMSISPKYWKTNLTIIFFNNR